MKNLDTNAIKKEVYAQLKINPKLEVLKITLENRDFWIKFTRQTRSNIFHHFIYLITKNPILIPVKTKSNFETTQYEISKLTNLHSKSIKVPLVVYKNSDFFVLEDCGKTVHEQIKYHFVDDIDNLLIKTIEELANLHNINEYHGASQIKNFTYKNDKVYLIDFEESFNNEQDLKTLQFRDLFLFMFSIAKYDINVDYIKLIQLYIDKTGNIDFFQRFSKLLSSVSFLIKIVELKFIWRVLDKDTKSIYKLFKTLQKG